MLKDEVIAVVGAGNMGRALIGGLFRSGNVLPENIRATRRMREPLDELARQFPGIQIFTENPGAVTGASVVIIAVKPQNVFPVLEEIRPHVSDQTLVISILAGISTASIGAALNRNLPVIRSMPNTPSLVDEGATAIAAGSHASERHLEIARHVFDAVGKVEIVPEYLMDAVTGLSGSGPAYVYMVIEALTDGGVKQGIPRPTALRLAAQTVYGAAKLVLDTGKHPAILRDEVTTPGGTAIAAVADLESHGLRTMLVNAVATATNRSRELSELNGK